MCTVHDNIPNERSRPSLRRLEGIVWRPLKLSRHKAASWLKCFVGGMSASGALAVLGTISTAFIGLSWHHVKRSIATYMLETEPEQKCADQQHFPPESWYEPHHIVNREDLISCWSSYVVFVAAFFGFVLGVFSVLWISCLCYVAQCRTVNSAWPVAKPELGTVPEDRRGSTSQPEGILSSAVALKDKSPKSQPLAIGVAATPKTRRARASPAQR